MRIAELARQLKVSPDWIRRLERAGLIPVPDKDLHGHRRYGPEDLERIRAVIFPPEDQEPGA